MKFWIFGSLGREVMEPCALGTLDMRPSGLLLFLTMTLCNSTPYPRHLLCSPQRPVMASYQTYYIASPLSGWSFPPTQGGWAQGRTGEGWRTHLVPGAVLSRSGLFHPTTLLVGGVSIFYGPGKTLFADSDHLAPLASAPFKVLQTVSLWRVSALRGCHYLKKWFKLLQLTARKVIFVYLFLGIFCLFCCFACYLVGGGLWKRPNQ